MKMSWFSKNCLERSTLQQNIVSLWKLFLINLEVFLLAIYIFIFLIQKRYYFYHYFIHYFWNLS